MGFIGDTSEDISQYLYEAEANCQTAENTIEAAFHIAVRLMPGGMFWPDDVVNAIVAGLMANVRAVIDFIRFAIEGIRFYVSLFGGYERITDVGTEFAASTTSVGGLATTIEGAALAAGLESNWRSDARDLYLQARTSEVSQTRTIDEVVSGITAALAAYANTILAFTLVVLGSTAAMVVAIVVGLAAAPLTFGGSLVVVIGAIVGALAAIGIGYIACHAAATSSQSDMERSTNGLAWAPTSFAS